MFSKNDDRRKVVKSFLGKREQAASDEYVLQLIELFWQPKMQ